MPDKCFKQRESSWPFYYITSLIHNFHTCILHLLVYGLQNYLHISWLGQARTQTRHYIDLPAPSLLNISSTFSHALCSDIHPCQIFHVNLSPLGIHSGMERTQRYFTTCGRTTLRHVQQLQKCCCQRR